MLNIQVVDDSFIMRRNILSILERLGHSVVAEAKNGKEAIDCYAKYAPHLVTMDITMPDMEGVAAVKEIKKIDKNAKIIMITSHGKEATVIDAIKAGASGYVLKPITAELLAKAIKKIYPEHTPAGKRQEFQNDNACERISVEEEDDFNIENFDFEEEFERLQ